MDDAERTLKIYVSLLDQMKTLSSYQLMGLYLQACVSIIDQAVFEQIPEEICLVIRGFKIKIESLSFKLGLDGVAVEVIRMGKLYKRSVKFSESDRRLVFSFYNFDECDGF